MSHLCDNAVSSDDKSDFESVEEDNDADYEGGDEYSRLVRKVSDIQITRCNKENGRKQCSGFVITCRQHLGHFFAWMGTHKRKHGKCTVECHNKNIHWSDLNLILEDVVVDFSTLWWRGYTILAKPPKNINTPCKSTSTWWKQSQSS